eukprot:scaffold133451_cov98-Phaeocystis_antarctica.AAC.1
MTGLGRAQGRLGVLASRLSLISHLGVVCGFAGPLPCNHASTHPPGPWLALRERDPVRVVLFIIRDARRELSARARCKQEITANARGAAHTGRHREKITKFSLLCELVSSYWQVAALTNTLARDFILASGV